MCKPSIVNVTCQFICGGPADDPHPPVEEEMSMSNIMDKGQPVCERCGEDMQLSDEQPNDRLLQASPAPIADDLAKEAGITRKEGIAAIIFDHEGEGYERPDEETCHAIADKILAYLAK